MFDLDDFPIFKYEPDHDDINRKTKEYIKRARLIFVPVALMSLLGIIYINRFNQFLGVAFSLGMIACYHFYCEFINEAISNFTLFLYYKELININHNYLLNVIYKDEIKKIYDNNKEAFGRMNDL